MTLIGIAKFSLGQIVATTHVADNLSKEDIHNALVRHEQGDWGDCEDEDKEQNDAAVTHGERIFSVYRNSGGKKFWIITEADRSVTTVLFPEDY